MFKANLRNLKELDNVIITDSSAENLSVELLFQSGVQVPYLVDQSIQLLNGRLSLNQSQTFGDVVFNNVLYPLGFSEGNLILEQNFTTASQLIHLLSSDNSYISNLTAGNVKMNTVLIDDATVSNLRMNNIQTPLYFNSTGNLDLKYTASLEVFNDNLKVNDSYVVLKAGPGIVFKSIYDMATEYVGIPNLVASVAEFFDIPNTLLDQTYFANINVNSNHFQTGSWNPLLGGGKLRIKSPGVSQDYRSVPFFDISGDLVYSNGFLAEFASNSVTIDNLYGGDIQGDKIYYTLSTFTNCYVDEEIQGEKFYFTDSTLTNCYVDNVLQGEHFYFTDGTFTNLYVDSELQGEQLFFTNGTFYNATIDDLTTNNIHVQPFGKITGASDCSFGSVNLQHMVTNDLTTGGLLASDLTINNIAFQAFGNITGNPDASMGNVQVSNFTVGNNLIVNQNSQLGDVTCANVISTSLETHDFEATFANITDLQVANSSFDNIGVSNLTCGAIYSNNATINNLQGTNYTIANIQATGITCLNLIAQNNATIESVYLNGDIRRVGNIKVDDTITCGSLIVNNYFKTYNGDVTQAPTTGNNITNKTYVDGIGYLSVGTGLAKSGSTLSLSQDKQDQDQATRDKLDDTATKTNNLKDAFESFRTGQLVADGIQGVADVAVAGGAVVGAGALASAGSALAGIAGLAPLAIAGIGAVGAGALGLGVLGGLIGASLKGDGGNQHGTVPNTATVFTLQTDGTYLETTTTIQSTINIMNNVVSTNSFIYYGNTDPSDYNTQFTTGNYTFQIARSPPNQTSSNADDSPMFYFLTQGTGGNWAPALGVGPEIDVRVPLRSLGQSTLSNLYSENITVSNLLATNGTITNLKATNNTVSNLLATNSTISNLLATNNSISNLVATNGSISNLKTSNITVSNLNLDNLLTVPQNLQFGHDSISQFQIFPAYVDGNCYLQSGNSSGSANSWSPLKFALFNSTTAIMTVNSNNLTLDNGSNLIVTGTSTIPNIVATNISVSNLVLANITASNVNVSNSSVGSLSATRLTSGNIAVSGTTGTNTIYSSLLIQKNFTANNIVGQTLANTSCLTLISPSLTMSNTTTLNTAEPVLQLARIGLPGTCYDSLATFYVSKRDFGTGGDTQLDIKLTAGATGNFDSNVNVISFSANQDVTIPGKLTLNNNTFNKFNNYSQYTVQQFGYGTGGGNAGQLTFDFLGGGNAGNAVHHSITGINLMSMYYNGLVKVYNNLQVDGSATVGSLSVGSQTIANLVSTNGTITNLQSTNSTLANLRVNTGTLGSIQVSNSTITNLRASGTFACSNFSTDTDSYFNTKVVASDTQDGTANSTGALQAPSGGMSCSKSAYVGQDISCRNITVRNWFGFSYRLSSDQNNLLGSNIIKFDSTSNGGYNIGSCYSTSTGAFTVTKAGYYEFSCAGKFWVTTNATDNKRSYLYFKFGDGAGSTLFVPIGEATFYTGSASGGGSIVRYCPVGAYCQIQVDVDGASGNYANVNAGMIFSGSLLSV